MAKTNRPYKVLDEEQDSISRGMCPKCNAKLVRSLTGSLTCSKCVYWHSIKVEIKR